MNDNEKNCQSSKSENNGSIIITKPVPTYDTFTKHSTKNSVNENTEKE